MKTCGQCKHFAGNKEWTEKRQIAKEEYRGEFFICGYLCFGQTEACDLFEEKL